MEPMLIRFEGPTRISWRPLDAWGKMAFDEADADSAALDVRWHLLGLRGGK